MEISRGAYIFLVLYCSILSAVILIILLYICCRKRFKTKRAAPVAETARVEHIVKSEPPVPPRRINAASTEYNVLYEGKNKDGNVEARNINRTTGFQNLHTVDDDGNVYQSANEDSQSDANFEDVISYKSRQSYPSVSNTVENYEDIRRSSSSSSSSSSASSVKQVNQRKEFSQQEFSKNIKEFKESIEEPRRKISKSSSSSSLSTMTSLKNPEPALRKIEKDIALEKEAPPRGFTNFGFEREMEHSRPATDYRTSRYPAVSTETPVQQIPTVYNNRISRRTSSSSSSRTTVFGGDEPEDVFGEEDEIIVVEIHSSRSSSMKSASSGRSQHKMATKYSPGSSSSSEGRKQDQEQVYGYVQGENYLQPRDYSLPRSYRHPNINKTFEQIGLTKNISQASSQSSERNEVIGMARRISDSSKASSTMPTNDIPMAQRVSESSTASSSTVAEVRQMTAMHDMESVDGRMSRLDRQEMEFARESELQAPLHEPIVPLTSTPVQQTEYPSSSSRSSSSSSSSRSAASDSLAERSTSSLSYHQFTGRSSGQTLVNTMELRPASLTSEQSNQIIFGSVQNVENNASKFSVKHSDIMTRQSAEKMVTTVPQMSQQSVELTRQSTDTVLQQYNLNPTSGNAERRILNSPVLSNHRIESTELKSDQRMRKAPILSKENVESTSQHNQGLEQRMNAVPVLTLASSNVMYKEKAELAIPTSPKSADVSEVDVSVTSVSQISELVTRQKIKQESNSRTTKSDTRPAQSVRREERQSDPDYENIDFAESRVKLASLPSSAQSVEDLISWDEPKLIGEPETMEEILTKKNSTSSSESSRGEDGSVQFAKKVSVSSTSSSEELSRGQRKVSEMSISSIDSEPMEMQRRRSFVPSTYTLEENAEPMGEHSDIQDTDNLNKMRMARKVSDYTSSSSSASVTSAESQNLNFLAHAQKVSDHSPSSEEEEGNDNEFIRTEVGWARKVSVTSSISSGDDVKRFGMARKVSVTSSSSAVTEESINDENLQSARRISTFSTASSAEVEIKPMFPVDQHSNRNHESRNRTSSSSSSSSEGETKTLAEANILPQMSQSNSHNVYNSNMNISQGNPMNSSYSLSSQIFSELGTNHPAGVHGYSSKNVGYNSQHNLKTDVLGDRVRKIEVRTSSSSHLTSEEEDEDSRQFRESVLNFNALKNPGRSSIDSNTVRMCSRVEEVSETGSSSSGENSKTYRSYNIAAGTTAKKRVAPTPPGPVQGSSPGTKLFRDSSIKLPADSVFSRLNSDYESVYSSGRKMYMNREAEA